MPYIQTVCNVPIQKETEQQLKEKLGQAIAIIPGKSEAWLMLAFQPDTAMYFRGDAQPMVYCEVSLFGSTSDAVYENLTKELTDIYTALLPVSADHVYVKYEEAAHWGWNGTNF